MKPILRLKLQLDYNTCIELSKELDEYIIRDTFAPLDFPDKVNDSMANLCCTNASIIKQVTKTRETLAASLAEELTSMILTTMESNDTIMGYAKS